MRYPMGHYMPMWGPSSHGVPYITLDVPWDVPWEIPWDVTLHGLFARAGPFLQWRPIHHVWCPIYNVPWEIPWGLTLSGLFSDGPWCVVHPAGGRIGHPMGRTFPSDILLEIPSDVSYGTTYGTSYRTSHGTCYGCPMGMSYGSSHISMGHPI